MRNLNIYLALIVLACSFQKSWSQLPIVDTFERKVVIIELRDSLGKVAVETPSNFDTLFILRDSINWQIPGHRQRYIFKPKDNSVLKKRNSSEEYFAVVHTRLFPITGIYDTPIYGRRQLFKGRLLKDFPYRDQISGNVEIINNREFFTIYTAGYDKSKNRYFAIFAAVTMIQDHDIEFHYFIETKRKFDSQVFFRRSLFLLRFARLSNGI